MKSNNTQDAATNAFEQEQQFLNKLSEKVLVDFYNSDNLNDIIEIKQRTDSRYTKYLDKIFNLVGSYNYLFNNTLRLTVKKQYESLVLYVNTIFSVKTDEDTKRVIDFLTKIETFSQNLLKEFDMKELFQLSKDKEDELQQPFQEPKKIIMLLENLLKESTIPVKMAVDMNNLLKSSALTYGDLLKINTSLTVDVDYFGYKAFRAFNAIYSNPTFVNELQKAVKMVDDIKKSTIFYEVLLTVKEAFAKEGANKDIKWKEIFDGSIECKEIKKIISQDDATDYDESADSINENSEKTVNLNNSLETIINIANESLAKDDKEFKESKELTPDEFIKSFYLIINSDKKEYMQEIYAYIKDNIKEWNPDKMKLVSTYMRDNKLDYKGFATRTSQEIEKLRNEYKELAQILCREIDKEQRITINGLVTEMIGTMLLTSKDEKQYLISIFYDQKLSTVQHLIQTMNLIENGRMKSSRESLRKYNNLYTYIKNEFDDDFAKVSVINSLFDKQSFLYALQQLLNLILDSNNCKEL